jgi:hypothetical protein
VFFDLLPGIKGPEILVKSGVAHRFLPKFPGVFLMVATWDN